MIPATLAAAASPVFPHAVSATPDHHPLLVTMMFACGVFGILLVLNAIRLLDFGVAAIGIILMIWGGVFGYLNWSTPSPAPTPSAKTYAGQMAAVETWLDKDYGIHADEAWVGRLLKGQVVGAVIDGHQVTISAVHLPGNHIGLVDENKEPLEPLAP